MRYGILLLGALALGACTDVPPTEPRNDAPPGSAQPDTTPQTPPPASVPQPAPTDVGEPTGAATATATIGAAGGTLTSADQRIVLAVPAGALTGATSVSVQPIRNHAHGGMGVAYRLQPHGVTFAKPVRLTFRYADADIAGTSPELLRVAYQDTERRWRMFRQLSIDTVARTVSVETTHFSDWSLVASVQLLPGHAKIKAGESVTLRVQDCHLPEVPGTDLVSVVYECRDGLSGLMTGEWYVNGEETHQTDGTITPSSSEFGKATYTAPDDLPKANPVAVSVEHFTLSRARNLLISHIEVERDGTLSAFSFLSTARYGLSYGAEGERVTGDAMATQKIETEWTVTPAGTEAGKRVYRLRGVNRITLDGLARIGSTGAADGLYTGTTTATLKGTSTSSNPEDSSEWMTGLAVGPEDFGPNPLEAGVLRTWTEGDRHMYELNYRPAQVVPSVYTTTSEERWRCRDDKPEAKRTISFNNTDRRTWVTADDPGECFPKRRETEWPGPFMFGSVAWNVSASHPDGGRWTSLRGTYDPRAGFIEGSLEGEVTTCERVWKLDPLQWFEQILPNVAAISAPDVRTMGHCTLNYTIGWKIFLP